MERQVERLEKVNVKEFMQEIQKRIPEKDDKEKWIIGLFDGNDIYNIKPKTIKTILKKGVKIGKAKFFKNFLLIDIEDIVEVLKKEN